MQEVWSRGPSFTLKHAPQAPLYTCSNCHVLRGRRNTSNYMVSYGNLKTVFMYEKHKVSHSPLETRRLLAMGSWCPKTFVNWGPLPRFSPDSWSLCNTAGLGRQCTFPHKALSSVEDPPSSFFRSTPIRDSPLQGGSRHLPCQPRLGGPAVLLQLPVFPPVQDLLSYKEHALFLVWLPM